MQKEFIELLKKGIEELMPANQLLGIKILEVKSGYAHLHVPFKNEFIGDFIQERWHGGFLAAIADTAGGTAAATTLQSPKDKLNTIDMRIDYLHAATSSDIEAKAQVIKDGKTIVKVDIQLFQDHQENPVVVDRCVFSKLIKENSDKLSGKD
tara:strand:+ start:392 stop:847 length:456 start_codon:yes stop_codon:yes gene_type:complete